MPKLHAIEGAASIQIACSDLWHLSRIERIAAWYVIRFVV
jgi:hypothetical protein